MTTGEKIKALRKKANMSQEQLAHVLGLSRQAISRWETENAIPETNIVLKLSESFHVTTDYLLKDSVDNPPEQRDVDSEPKISKFSSNLIIGIGSAIIAFIVFLIVLIISTVEPMMKVGTTGILDLNFWIWNDLLPFVAIILIGSIVSIFHLGKYYFQDWQPK